MSDTTRRKFLFQVAAGASALTLARFATAEEAVEDKPALDPNDPYAKAMGFVVNTADADSAKFTKHSPDQQCSKCQLFKGDEGDELAACSFFGNRKVPATGWCRNFKPKEGAA